MRAFLLQRLKMASAWQFVGISIVSSVLLMAIINGIISLVTSGRISRELLVYCVIDAMIVPAIVALVAFNLFRRAAILRDLYQELQQEISERKEAAQSLRLLEKALETMNLGVTVSNPEGIIIYTNPAEAHLHGYTVDELLGKPSRILAPSVQWKPLTVEEKTQLQSWQRESINVRKDGSLFPVYLFSDIVKDDRGRLMGLVTSCLDISERKQAEEALRRAHDELELRVKERTLELAQANQELREGIAQRVRIEAALRESEERYRSHFENVNDVIYSIGSDLRILNVSPSVERHLGYTPKEWIGRCMSELNLLAPTSVEAAFSDALRVLSGERIDSAVYEFIAKDGTKKLSEVSGSPLFQDGKVVALVSVARDITERKRTEEQIQQSLREKELLLKEIHHRVKNNLQVVCSLLSLQSNLVQDRASLEVLHESQNRVKSMALIHEKLYQSQDLTRIDFAEYVRQLTMQLLRSYQVNPGLVMLYVDVSKDAHLGIDTAIPCGLIVNELVSNALKHAFPAGRRGEVCVTLGWSEKNQLTLVVRDNGVGFPLDADFRNTETLGLQLVVMLVDQLDGVIELDRAGGTGFTITFVEPLL